MKDWYYGSEGQQHGPLEEEALKALIQSGEISPDTLIWKEGMSDWLPVAQIPEFTQTSPTMAAHDGSVYAPPSVNPATAGGGYPPIPPTSGLAIASLVCGVLAILGCCVYIGIIFGIPAVICGHMSMKQFRDPQKPMQGKGMSIAGLICGYLGSLFSLILIGFVAFAFQSSKTIFNNSFEEMREELEESSEQELESFSAE